MKVRVFSRPSRVKNLWVWNVSVDGVECLPRANYWEWASALRYAARIISERRVA